MKILKQYRLVLAIILLAASAILIRTYNFRSFKYDAVKLAEPSVLRTNIITEDQIAQIKGERLIVDLRPEGATNEMSGEISLKVNPDSILAKKYLDILRKQDGPVILASSDNSVSSRIWMVLSQMGMKNIFILSKQQNPEELKKEFRPDSVSGPES